MNEVYLLIGGNIGDRQHYLTKAKNFILNNCGMLVQQSSLYETAAWGYTQQPSFLNQALALKTSLLPETLLELLLQTEKQEGRNRGIKYGPRTIDIDILFYNNAIIERKDLVIPHPQIANRRFVLTPLSEIAGDLVHPVLLKTVSELLASCPDPLMVRKISGNVF